MRFINPALLYILFFSSSFLSAQDQSIHNLKEESRKTINKPALDTIQKNWKNGGQYSFNLSQGSLSNWAAGGDEFSLSLNSYLNLFAFYKKGKHSWDNSFDFNLGYVKTTSLGNRKNDDRIELLSKYGYAIGKKLNLSGLFNFRSQLFDGFTYPKNIETFSSTFLAPAYIILSPGIDYKPNDEFSLFVSPVTIRWVIVNDDRLSAIGAYGVNPGEKSNTEIGAFLTANYSKNLNKTITYKGKLDLFSNYKRKPENVDVFMSNIFSAKVSKVLAVTWSLDIIYDDDVKLFGPNGNSPGTQIKSLLGIGFQARF